MHDRCPDCGAGFVSYEREAEESFPRDPKRPVFVPAPEITVECERGHRWRTLDVEHTVGRGLRIGNMVRA